MARRSSTPTESKPADEPTTEAVESTEEAVAATTDDGEATTTEATESAESKPEEKPIDLEPFKAEVEKAIAEADTSTGDMPKSALDEVNKVYREVETIKGKNAARAHLDEQMKAAVTGKDIVRARAFVEIKDNLTAAGGTSTPKAPTDPTQAFVNKVVGLRLAADELLNNVPEGVNESWAEKADDLVSELSDQLEAYRAFVNSDDDDAEAPEVSPVVRQVFKLAAGRAAGGGGTSRAPGAPRRDIGAHITQVFADLEPGSFLTVNEIAKAASAEYGDDRPSAGAVSARLFPKGREAYKSDTVEASAEEGKSRGAVRLG